MSEITGFLREDVRWLGIPQAATSSKMLNACGSEIVSRVRSAGGSEWLGLISYEEFRMAFISMVSGTVGNIRKPECDGVLLTPGGEQQGRDVT